jgi:hypothetical protein
VVRYLGWAATEGPRTSTIVVSSGHPCSRRVGINATKGTLHGVVVTSPPRNGRATMGGTTVTYRSNTGFRGTDTFITTVYSSNKKGTRHNTQIIWAVTVR